MLCSEIPILTSVLASFAANSLSADEIDLLAVIFTQLGDTLATIAVTNEICQKRKESLETK